MKETLNTSTEDSVLKSSVASEEAKEYFKLATPMLLTQLAAHATGIIAALMTGNYNTLDQAAVAIGNMLFWPAYFGIAGVLFIITKVSRATAARSKTVITTCRTRLKSLEI